MKADGTLAREDHSFRVLVQRQEMTGAERSWASRYEMNDVIRYPRGSKGLGIEAGEYGTVVGVSSASNLLTFEKSTGEIVNYDPWRLHPPLRACSSLLRNSLFANQSRTDRFRQADHLGINRFFNECRGAQSAYKELKTVIDRIGQFARPQPSLVRNTVSAGTE